MILKQCFLFLIVLKACFGQIRLIEPHLDHRFSLNASLVTKNRILKELVTDLEELDAVSSQSGKDVQTVTIYGNSSLGYYFVDLLFGAKKQRQSLIIDTGSTITCLPCNSKIIHLNQHSLWT
jgi:hypothetical protein